MQMISFWVLGYSKDPYKVLFGFIFIYPGGPRYHHIFEHYATQTSGYG